MTATKQVPSLASRDDFLSRQDIIRQIVEMPDNYPMPMGFRVSVLMLTVPEKVGSIVVIDSTRDAQAMASPQGIVVGVGPDAYKDKRFPSGPWCKVGDRVVFQKYAGRLFQLANGQHLSALNDDDLSMIFEGENYAEYLK